MKKTLFIYTIGMMFILISSPQRSKSQFAVTDPIVENLKVCLDRTIYISGEKILFTAFILNNLGPAGDNFSKVIYCELISPGGNRITGGKYEVDNSIAHGCLGIPEETISGIYFLKSYSRFMRNGDPQDYNYIRLKIVNPYKSEVISGYKVVAADSVQVRNLPRNNDDQRFNLTVAKKVVHPKEEVEINIDGNPGPDERFKMCLSVIPAGTWSSISTTADSISGDLQYYPETRGISLSGRFLEKESGQAITNAKVNLSIIGDKDVMAVRTNSSGEFYFALPDYNGNHDIFLCGEDIPDISPTIYIDNDFCTQPVILQAPAFHLDDMERETAYKLAVNQKLTSVFKNSTTIDKNEPPINSLSFYGKPDNILVIDKYIDLPTLEEYFYELLSAISVRKQDGRKRFRFITDRTEMTIYDPLVMIDWVAVDDVERILAMSPKGIDRIELIKSPYFKGNITYGGIISFISKKNDFAGIDLPASGTFVNYKFFEECSSDSFPESYPNNIPDSRNTIYWNPDVQLNEKGSAELLFTAPDTPGKYSIVLRGMAFEGEDIIIRKEIEVTAE